MPDEPIEKDAEPVPIGPRPGRRTPPESMVRDLRASLRATDAYACILKDRIDLASTSNLVRLDGVPADTLAQLIAASETFQDSADRALRHVDQGLARAAHVVASLARTSARAGDGPDT